MIYVNKLGNESGPEVYDGDFLAYQRGEAVAIGPRLTFQEVQTAAAVFNLEANLADALSGPVFEPLRDQALFAQVAVEPELETVTWPNGADLAPEFLYFKAFQDDPTLTRQFEEWGYVPKKLRQ